MKIEETWSYDAPADRVFEMLLDPAFQEAKCAATGALSHSVSIKEQPPRQVIETHREMATEGLPENVARLVGKTLKVIEVQSWGEQGEDGSRVADIDVSIGGLPINYVGTIRMTSDGDSTDMRVSGDLRAKIPLVGGKVESASAPAISSGVQIEAQTGKEYLAG
ncbi:hypothetical protein GCM10011492_32690 [Flexivirga endophytica]|uniref:DUF2505 domain-containing protein n=1 Tax=Flexivirga endophytica TaxID=1849103 RepID=A0A916WWF5_9MICO|nr:DUF2505 domain-containing protein [Flexivirga endophytica]GGB39376.1 hypothetical protein GCM10011492_32690 [Flexivirga endophytica]GHB47286.1 hypothetical protein GCM10008112_15080 [Flexivirga endophytica]